ncbi:MAG: hypothetical protein RIM99_04845 [Cyclobacteriaceae bacterium]
MKHLILISLVFCYLTGFSQQRFQSNQQHFGGFGLGGSMAMLDFTNEEGIVNKDLKGIPGVTASFLLQYTLKQATGSKFAPRTSLTWKSGYANHNLKDKSNNVVSRWSMHYWSNSLTVFRHLDSRQKVNPYFGAGLFSEFLTGGTQTLGFEQYDLTEFVNRLNWGASIDLGISYRTANDAFSTMGINYSRGLTNLDKDEGQEALLHHFQIYVTTLFEFTKRKRRRK